MIPLEQTKQQRLAAFQAAGLTTQQQAGVTAGIGYTPPVAPTATGLPTPTITPSTSFGSQLIGGISGIIPSTSLGASATTGSVLSARNQYQSQIDKQAEDFSIANTSVATPAEIAHTGMISSYDQLSQKLFGKTTFTQQAEINAGVTGAEKAVTDLNTQINTLQNEAKQATLALTGQGRGIPQGVLNLQGQDIERQRTIKALQLNSFLYAAQGNLDLAQKTADKAVSAQFAPIEAEIAHMQNLITLNKGTMSIEQSRQSEQIQLRINERTRLLGLQKQDATDKSKVIQDAISNGLTDTAVMNNMNNAGSALEASVIAAQAGVVSKEMFDRQIEIEKLNLAEQKSKEELGDHVQMIAFAQQYASTGKIPTGMPKGSFGIVAQIAKESPQVKGALIDRNTGIKPSSLSAEQEKGMTALSEIVQSTLPELQRLFPKLYTGIFGGIGGVIYTTQNRQDYLTFRAEFLAKLLVARSGATVTPQEYDRYSKLLPTTFNQPFLFGSDGAKKLNSLQKSMVTNLNTSLNTHQVAIIGYSTIKLGGVDYKIGDTIQLNGKQGRVLADGSIVPIQ